MRRGLVLLLSKSVNKCNIKGVHEGIARQDLSYVVPCLRDALVVVGTAALLCSNPTDD